MPNAIQGDDIQLYLSEGEGSAGYTLVGCGRDLSLSLNNSFLSISDFTPDAYKVLPTFTNATISSGNLFIINPDDDALSSVVLMNWANEKTLLNWRITTTDFECFGQCYIQTWTLNASYNTVADVAMEMVVNGKVTINSEVPCIAVSFDAVSLPDGATGVPYESSFPISGTAPFNITAVTKPAWMSIDIIGGEVVISGTPDASGTGIAVSFTIENCSGDSAAFSDTIDVSASCVGVSIVGTPELPDATVGEAYTYSFGLTGTAPFSLDNVFSPGWMNIEIDGSNVVFSGTPTTGQIGASVSFDLLNPCGSDAFADTLNVAEIFGVSFDINMEHASDSAWNSAQLTTRVYTASTGGTLVGSHNRTLFTGTTDVNEATIALVSGVTYWIELEFTIAGVSVDLTNTYTALLPTALDPDGSGTRYTGVTKFTGGVNTTDSKEFSVITTNVYRAGRVSFTTSGGDVGGYALYSGTVYIMEVGS